MKESILKTDKNIVFRETFGSKDLVRANGGLPTGVTFANGQASFNGTSNYINYKIPLQGIYSVRFRLNYTGSAYKKLFDFRGTNNNGTGYIQINNTNIVAPSSGTSYVNGVATTTVIASSNIEIVVTGINIISGTGTNINTVGVAFNLSGDWYSGTMELVEIYKGTLTANEVKNLYEQKQNKEINNYSKQLVTNPDFLTDTSWSKEAGWTISSGAARCDGTNGARLTQSLGSTNLIATQQYKVSYKVNVTSGSLGILLGGNGTATTISASTETSEIKVVGSIAAETLYFISTNFVGSVDYIYVEQVATEILRVDARNGVISNKYSGSQANTTNIMSGYDFTNWTPEPGVTINSSTSFTNTTINTGILKSGVFTAGKTYRLYCVFTTNSSSLKLYNYSGATTFISNLTSGSYLDFVPAGTGISLANGSTSSTTTITEFRIYEVIPSVTPTAVSVVRSGNVYAMDFNGTTSLVDCGSYNTLIGDKTFVAWVKVNGPGEFSGDGYGRFIDNSKVIMDYRWSTKGFRFSRDNSIVAVTPDNTFKAGLWYSLIITSTSTGVTNFYINGVATGTANQAAGTPAAGVTNITIGNISSGIATAKGQISNARIIDGILSTQEITQIWQSEKGFYNL